ncbi:hypothetical protein [Clostridium estertheticum]|uniref:hypothetical protein n=1 Tax=Clostridium estertheticum TaxID=238834 RepID=UPI00124D7B9A|nr:hypothetical protein [Clostridium estertheticum]MBZ9616782.1 hypothetical protein [Clostridium estertheticum subsp. laramiense]WAG72489.1 hypothetical protein LL032_15190 [Clostridium estertheticum]
MERLKVSEFKSISKFNFINGMFKKVEKNLEGKELEFYDINEEAIKALTEKKISNNDIEFLYDLIPVVSNVDTDIDFKEFDGMCKLPSPQFAEYISLLLKHFSNLYKSAGRLKDLSKDVTSTISELGIELPKEKTKEEQLEELYAELANVKDDKVRRKEILIQITKLDVEDNE